MNAEDAVKIINGDATLNTDGTLQNNAEQSEDNAEPTSSNDANVDKADKLEKKPTDETDSKKGIEEKSEDKSVKSIKKKYSREERQKHAFKLQRDKLKASQNRIKELEDKLSKYDGISKDKFEDEDKYIDYKVDISSDKRELEHLKNEQVAQQMEYAKDISEQRIKSNFSDEQEEKEYRQLLNVAMNNFSSIHPEYGIDNFADFVAEDRTVLEYLADSDNAPRLIRHFIAKPDSLIKIMKMTSPMNKHAALSNMERAMVNYFKTRDIKGNVKPMPSTGRVVNNKISNTTDNKWNKKWSAADALKYLKSK